MMLRRLTGVGFAASLEDAKPMEAWVAAYHPRVLWLLRRAKVAKASLP